MHLSYLFYLSHLFYIFYLFHLFYLFHILWNDLKMKMKILKKIVSPEKFSAGKFFEIFFRFSPRISWFWTTFKKFWKKNFRFSKILKKKFEKFFALNVMIRRDLKRFFDLEHFWEDSWPPHCYGPFQDVGCYRARRKKKRGTTTRTHLNNWSFIGHE